MFNDLFYDVVLVLGIGILFYAVVLGFVIGVLFCSLSLTITSNWPSDIENRIMNRITKVLIKKNHARMEIVNKETGEAKAFLIPTTQPKCLLLENK